MKIKVYNALKPIVTFCLIGRDVCYKYNNNIEKVNLDSITKLKNELSIPYKVEFYGLSRSIVGRILGDLNDNEIEIFCYRVKNPKSNLLKFHAIFTEKTKIKKLER